MARPSSRCTVALLVIVAYAFIMVKLVGVKHVYKMYIHSGAQTGEAHDHGTETISEALQMQGARKSGQPRKSGQHSAPLNILLVTYMRGGSSFVGDLFNNNPDVFYWFEPLAPLFIEMLGPKTDGRNWMLHGNLSLRYFDNEWKNKFFSVFESIFHCNISGLPRSVLSHKFATSAFWNKSTKLVSYRRCLSGAGQKALPQNLRLKHCAKISDQLCRNSPMRVIKTVRMRMDLVHGFVKRFQDVQIVQLIRDPRAILNSRWASSPARRNNTLDTDILCPQMLYDIHMKNQLDKQIPGVVTKVKYEDIALSPTAATQDLYNALGMGHLPMVITSWIETCTRAARNNGPIGTRRKNSTMVVYQWRNMLSCDMQRYITEQCEDVLKDHAYSVSMMCTEHNTFP